MKTRNCELHGDYEVEEKYMEFLEKTIEIGKCKECEELKKQYEIDSQEEQNTIRRENKRINAGISPRLMGKTFDDYRADAGSKQERAKNTFVRLSEEMLNGNKGFNIIASGGVGTGKTLLAAALINAIVDTKYVRIIKCIDLVRELKETWHRDSQFSESDIIRKYSNLNLLIIDEVGVQFGSDTEKLFIFDIIDGRYQNMLPTVLISNRSIEDIKKEVGDRVIDRLREDGGTLVVFDWDSQRVKK